VIEREPSFPLRVGKAAAVLERFGERRQFGLKVGIFGEQRLLLPLIRRGATHFADEMHDRVAMGDVDVELVERIAAEILEVLLHLHGDIVPRQIAAQLIPVNPELVGNSRKKDADRHAARRSSSAWTLPHIHNAEHGAAALRGQRRRVGIMAGWRNQGRHDEQPEGAESTISCKKQKLCYTFLIVESRPPAGRWSSERGPFETFRTQPETRGRIFFI
jgi:hypothetical protein